MELDKIKKEIGLKIKSYRMDNKYTQEYFCSIIELEQPNLSNIETGKTLPDFKTICTIIEKTNIEPNFLFDFLKKAEKYDSIDYQFLELFLNLPHEKKIKIKEFIEML